MFMKTKQSEFLSACVRGSVLVEHRGLRRWENGRTNLVKAWTPGVVVALLATQSRFMDSAFLSDVVMTFGRQKNPNLT